MNLTVEITGDASSAVEASEVSQASLDALTAAIGKLTESFIAQSGASDEASAGVAKVGATAGAASKELTDLNAAGGNAARMFSALGVSGGEAAGRVGALAGSLGSMGALAPGLIATIGGLAAAFAGLDFLREGVKDAEEFESEMTTMGQAIKAQGGSWDTLSSQVKNFIDTESLASGITRTEVAAALNEQVTALAGVESGTKAVSDAEKTVAVAEEVAVGRHEDVLEVTRALTSAEIGRGLQAARMVVSIKDLERAHGSYDELLKVLHADYGKELEDTNNAEMAQRRLGAAYGGVGEEVGEKLLPVITELSGVLMGSIPAIGDLAHALADGLGGAFKIVAGGAMATVHATIAAFDAIHGDISDAKAYGADALHDLASMGKGFAMSTVGWMGDIGKAAGDFKHSYVTAEDDITAAIRAHEAALKDLNTQFDPDMGFARGGAKKGAGGGTPFSFSPEEITAQPATADFKNQTDVVRQLADAFAQLPKNIDGYNHALATLAPLIDADTRQQAQLTLATETAQQKYAAAISAYNAGEQSLNQAKAAYNEFGTAMADGSIEPSKKNKAALEQLRLAVDDAKQNFDNLSHALSSAKSNYDAVAGALEKVHTQLDGLNHLATENQDAIQKLGTAWDAYVTKTQEDDAADYLAFGKSAAQKYALYKQLADNMHLVDEASLAQKDQFYSKEMAAYYQMLEQEQTQYQQFTKDAEKYTEQFVDDFLQKHKSLESQVKEIYNDLLKAFIEMATKMIWESKLVAEAEQWFLGALGAGANVNQGANQAANAFFSSGGFGMPGMGAGIAGGGASTSATTAANAASIGSALSGIGSAASASGIGSDLYGPNAASGWAPGGSGTTMLTSGAGATGLRVGGLPIGDLMLGALGGALLSGAVFGNQGATGTEDQLGGALGGVGGMLAGNLLGHLLFTGGMATGPAGMIVGALLGSLLGGALGGMFGDHFPRADEPDVYQTQLWGQELADLQGSTAGDPMNANGQQFTMDSWTNSQTSGKGWNILMEQFVQMFRSNQKELPAELQAGFNEIEKLWGGATNTADFNSNGKNGMLQIGSGEMAEWTTFWEYVSAYGPAIAQLMQMYAPMDLYAASMNGQVSEMGGYSPSGSPWLIHNFPDVGTPAGSGQAPETLVNTIGGSKRTVTNVNVYQQFGGSAIADSNMQKYIADVIGRIPMFAGADLNL